MIKLPCWHWLIITTIKGDNFARRLRHRVFVNETFSGYAKWHPSKAGRQEAFDAYCVQALFAQRLAVKLPDTALDAQTTATS